MKKKLLWAFGIVWMLVVCILLFNASLWAPYPKGKTKMIAHRGVYHQFDRTNLGRDDCTATRISEPTHEIFENTVHSIRAAVNAKADMVEIDIAPTKDGKMVLFHDWAVDCRTGGKGDTRNLTLGELKALDIGYGYSADGGKTYPLRGLGVGKIPTVEEALASETFKPFLFNFKSGNPGEADQLAAILKAEGRDPVKEGDGFYGAEAPVKRIRELIPEVWAWSMEEAKVCTKDYITTGWTGILPKSCEGRTLIVPLNYQWMIWGWPNRAIDRMEKYGGHIIVIGPYEDGNAPAGLRYGKQLADIPSSFNGWIMVDDILAVGPALIR